MDATPGPGAWDGMEKLFVAEREDRPGAAWLERFRAGREEAERWYRGDGLTEPPTAAACRAALRRHMPELLPHYDGVCGLLGDDADAHRIVSQYRPAPLPAGCSTAVWLGEGGPALVRNYDFRLELVTGRFELARWSDRRVIIKAQRPWGGCVDGMNDDGLVVALNHGGSPARGLGFAVILVLRYLLETCRSVPEATAALCRIPVALSQTVALLDRSGDHATVFLGPDREPEVTPALACTNHQETVTPGSSSAIRLAALDAALADPAMTLAGLTGRLLAPPLFSRRAGFTTVYTAAYRPTEGRVDYLWPGRCWSQGFDRFDAGSYLHDYGVLA